MPTDTPPAAPSPLATEIARQFADSEDSEMLTAIIDAKLAPVREAMEHMKAGNHNHAVLCPVCKSVFASLSPQPPEART